VLQFLKKNKEERKNTTGNIKQQNEQVRILKRHGT
jgi:hypothetical protein